MAMKTEGIKVDDLGEIVSPFIVPVFHCSSVPGSEVLGSNVPNFKFLTADRFWFVQKTHSNYEFLERNARLSAN
jgi:hypothetical protein